MTRGTERSAVALDEPPGDGERAGPYRSAGSRGGPSRAGLPAPAPPADPPRRRVEEGLVWLDTGTLVAVAALLCPDPTMGLLTVLTTVGCYAGLGLYRRRLTLSVLDDLPALLAGTGAGTLAGAAFSVAPGSRAVHVVQLAAVGTLTVAAGRTLAYHLVRRERRRLPPAPTLIVGTAQLGCQLGQLLLDRPHYGLKPVGYLDDLSAVHHRDLPAPLLGGCRDLADTVTAFGVRQVVVAFGLMRPTELVALLRACDQLRCRVLFVPRLPELHQGGRGTDHIGGIPLVRLRPAAPRRRGWRVKRLLDVVVAAAGLALAAPVLAVCALAVRIEGGPGVVFRQERVSRDGSRFLMLKFRSLRPASEWESQTQWTVAGDPRLGPVGRLLRNTSLDELPQLVNVLRGDMSLVGPRPERPFFVEQFSQRYPYYTARHRVPAGLTGWAAVNGLRGDTSIAERVRFDNSYIENWSLWLDVKIMVRTLGSVLTRTGG